MSEKYYGISPYAYCGGDPVNLVDPDGEDAVFITFPKYRAGGIPLIGHSGVLLINNKTGLTKYYEYRRYDKENKGIVRNNKIPNAVIENGKPTAESLNSILSVISKISGKGEALEGAYVDSDNFDIMNDYAQKKVA